MTVRIHQLKELHEKQLRVAIVGDIIVDRYIFGEVERVSPEAPVPVCRVTRDEIVPGGAANVARNLAGFGCQTELIGVVGDNDEASRQLFEMAAKCGIGTEGCVADSSRPTTVKTRVLGNGQQITRIDREESLPVSGQVENSLISRCRDLSEAFDLVIVSDYAKGVLTKKVVDALRQVSLSGTLVAIDPHPDNLVSWEFFSIIKPNFAEFCRISGQDIRDYVGGDPRLSIDFREAVAVTARQWQAQHLLITLGSNGMYYHGLSNNQEEWLPTNAAEVFDVSGAGDTSISFFALALAAGWDSLSAMFLANAASGIVVRKIGTASVSYDELSTCMPDSDPSK